MKDYYYYLLGFLLLVLIIFLFFDLPFFENKTRIEKIKERLRNYPAGKRTVFINRVDISDYKIVIS